MLSTLGTVKLELLCRLASYEWRCCDYCSSGFKRNQALVSIEKLRRERTVQALKKFTAPVDTGNGETLCISIYILRACCRVAAAGRVQLKIRRATGETCAPVSRRKWRDDRPPGHGHVPRDPPDRRRSSHVKRTVNARTVEASSSAGRGAVRK